MQIQTDHGERLEEEWYSKLNYYQSKYPEESVEFKILLNGGLVPGWESSLPVIFFHTTSNERNHLVSLR